MPLMAKTLVTGGAGYIGSHIVRMLAETGHDTVVVDDLSEGHPESLAGLSNVELIRADFSDTDTLDHILAGGAVDTIVHMAAFCEVGQSVLTPVPYYENNVTKSLRLAEAAIRHGVKGLVFSSSAATYGEPQSLPITEDHLCRPMNPYGETKLVFERALASYAQAYGLRSVALRYFNAAGAHPDGTMGEDHAPESHVIPLLFRATLEGAEPMGILGTDYPTRDGTCVRDFVHVQDLAQAHILALGHVRNGTMTAEAFNLGSGEGFSILELIDAVERTTGRRPATREAPRRPGDPGTLVASAKRARQQLGWKPEYPDLDAILRTAWQWHRNHPRGYASKPE